MQKDRNDMHYQEIIHFWFNEIQPSSWWIKDAAFDLSIKEKYADVHAAAMACELSQWRKTPEGRLAEIIVLDQFSRQIYRGQALSFSNDALALALAQEAINIKADQLLPTQKRTFLYMPFMHSESSAIHQIACELFSIPGMEGNLDFEVKHKVIIDRFGRYPHRNKILNRPSTTAELKFLNEAGSTF